MSTVFNLDKYAGLARTEYIVDASVISSAVLASMVANTGGATTELAPTLVTPGGRILMSAPASADKSVLTIPVTFGNVGGSLKAWMVELSGLFCNTSRPTLQLRASSNSSETKYNGLKWDSSGVILEAIDESSTYNSQVAKEGNFFTTDRTDMGFLVDYQNPTVKSLQGHFGYARVAQELVSTQGTHSVRLTNIGGTSPSVIGFKQLKLTCFWGTHGETVTKVF